MTTNTMITTTTTTANVCHRFLVTPAADIIYRTISDNMKTIHDQKHALQKLQNEAQNLRIYNKSPWQTTSSHTAILSPIRSLYVLSCCSSHSVFLRTTAATAIASLSHRNSVCPSVCPLVRPSHGWISQKRSKLGSPNLHHWLPGRL